jgi:hypothetical protein
LRVAVLREALLQSRAQRGGEGVLRERESTLVGADLLEDAGRDETGESDDGDQDEEERRFRDTGGSCSFFFSRCCCSSGRAPYTRRMTIA